MNRLPPLPGGKIGEAGTGKTDYRHLWRWSGIKCEEQLKGPDFSVVLFRSDFVLFSEKNHMKAHTNQWLWTMTYPLERLAGATRRGPTTAPEVQKPSQ